METKIKFKRITDFKNDLVFKYLLSNMKDVQCYYLLKLIIEEIAHIKTRKSFMPISTTSLLQESGQPPAAGNDSARHIIPSHAALCQFAAFGRLFLFHNYFTFNEPDPMRNPEIVIFSK
mgnify:CR=1 FL=1